MSSKYLIPPLLAVTVLTGCGSDDESSPIDDNFLPVDETESAVPSVARQWNDVLLQGIRNDFARPTVHARNLFHTSAAMYDAWAAFSDVSSTYLLGKELLGSQCTYDDKISVENILTAREEAISYASYRLIQHRFKLSPDKDDTFEIADAFMQNLGYDIANESMDFSQGSAAALGNYIADCYIQYGFKDGSKEDILYSNIAYQPVNEPLQPELSGNPNISDMNRWQSLNLGTYIDQSGNEVDGAIEFLGPEWGQVAPFSLSEDDLTIHERDGFNYYVYHDPGMPPTYDGELAEQYKWNFALVSKWSSQLDPADGVLIDISPASQGNIDINTMPRNFVDMPQFYKEYAGGDIGKGYNLNPSTNEPYQPQMVPRGDYARVLAEFWADGPDSETPPGHWFVILNTVIEHADFERKFAGQGDELDALEFDVKAYFALGGAMHDSAITAWGIKGWYDYIRPVSSIRAMADLGQSTDDSLPSYHEDGIPLDDGLIELVTAEDPLAGNDGEHIGKIKVFAWKGPDYIQNPETDTAGVDWILAENWWPYQRPSFVTPPFAGYVSGHSTFSRAAAELMTELTGSAYFPGGMSGFEVNANEFLVFEQGPSVSMTLQWATYRDASDQCSLSRIWGGIHPPADDIPGRLMGEKIGKRAFSVANSYFKGER
ncbi:vanadium-dependent haloperoxidase [Thalassotalea nanhaiensis]|uniref:Vanadium-dependent haloperoxidase n=1 Tax=Thalassotalea nanhaiensis TaxID=3065648 RepID=A0ABY9TF21_9GAMM|nr:vanadium-dependent haloperoxidase [Colwelliaceae bacterium SQ345]